METTTALTPNTSFSQYHDLLKPLNARIQLLEEKFHMRGNEVFRNRASKGLCLGLSTMYMCQVAQGGFDKGEQFLKSFQIYKHLDNKNSNYQPDFYRRIKMVSIDQHIEAKLNEVLNETIYWHNFMNGHVHTYFNLSDFNAILSQYNDEPMNDKDFHAFFTKLYQMTIENNQKLRGDKCNKDFFLLWESECLNAGIKTKSEIIAQFESVQCFIKQSYFLDQKAILSSRGIDAHYCLPYDPYASVNFTIDDIIHIINDFALSNNFVFV